MDAKHLPQYKSGIFNPLHHSYYEVNVKLLNNMTPEKTMTSKVHHVREISAVRAKGCAWSFQCVSFTEVNHHQADPLIK